jgi:hypothetical protein
VLNTYPVSILCYPLCLFPDTYTGHTHSSTSLSVKILSIVPGWDCSVHATLLTNPEALTPILTTYFFSFCHCHLFAVHILPAYLFSCFIHSLPYHLFAAYPAAHFYSLPAHLFSCFFPCLSAYSAVYSFLACPVGSAHLFSYLFIPCLLVCSVAYLFLPAHLFSCLFIPSRPPIQLFINSLPAHSGPLNPRLQHMYKAV